MVSGLHYAVFPTAAGWVGVCASDDGLVRLTLPQPSETAARLGEATSSPDYFQDLEARLRAYYEGEPSDFPDVIAPSVGTPFQRRVWETARRIPRGQTRSYGWLAAQLGQPGAARAVGQALGRNPLPVIVPCHRVLAADGGLGGFTGGLAMKRQLLALEVGQPQSTR